MYAETINSATIYRNNTAVIGTVRPITPIEREAIPDGTSSGNISRQGDDLYTTWRLSIIHRRVMLEWMPGVFTGIDAIPGVYTSMDDAFPAIRAWLENGY